ncbi:MAG: F0F1 ATP synthase subunit B [Defluviitaleaceae bacterium]|nr:F0F1 ATP synthase subunit B [Defluviitaleaceae bacterium]
MNQFMLFLLNANVEERLFAMDAQTFRQLIPHLFNFIPLAIFITFILYKPVRNLLNERAARIARDLDEAETARTSANELKAQYEQRLKDIELERSIILDDARKLATERRNREIAEVKEEIAAMKTRAQLEIAAELAYVKEQVEQSIVDISTAMAGKLLTTTINAKAHSRLFDEAMAELEETIFKPAATL